MAHAICQRLLDLPDEILVSVFSFLDFDTLLKAVLVCKPFSALAESFLYQSITVLNGRQGAALTNSFLADHRRTSWVRSFLVSTKFGQDGGLIHIPPHLARMTHLQELRLETPDCNRKDPADRVSWVSLQDRYERIFEGASALIQNSAVRCLPHLKSCTIHFVDETKPLYSLTRYSMLFLHPTLRSLTVSCASTNWLKYLWQDLKDDPSLIKCTRLEHLHLEECDIYPPTLAILLSFPQNLRSLKISEGVRYDATFNERGSRMHGNVCPAALSEAITEHCTQSLESLSLSLGHLRRRGQHIYQYHHHLNLTLLANLKYLELDIRTTNLIRTRAPCDHAFWRRLPSGLEALRIFSIPLGPRLPFQAMERSYFPFDTCLAERNDEHGLPKLKQLTYCYEYNREDDYLSSDDDEEEEGKQSCIWVGA